MNETTKYYETTWFVWLMLFVAPPIGIYFMWKYNKYDTRQKIIISCVFGFFFLLWLNGLNSDDKKSASTKTNSTVSSNANSTPTTTPTPAPLTREQVLEIDKKLYKLVLDSEETTNVLSQGIAFVGKGMGSTLELYDLAKLASDNQQSFYYAALNVNEKAASEYIDACQSYFLNGKSIAKDLMKYLENENIKDLSNAKEALNDSSYVFKVMSSRMKFLSDQGIPDNEIGDIISNNK